MRSVFTVENQEIAITGDNPRTWGDPRSIALRIVNRGYSGAAGEPTTVHEQALEVNLEPSHARAIASALLSAATVAK